MAHSNSFKVELTQMLHTDSIFEFEICHSLRAAERFRDRLKPIGNDVWLVDTRQETSAGTPP